MTNDELIALIETYNQREQEQENRLITIFREMRDRPGSTRFIRFGNGRKWGTNDFQPMEERFSLPATVFSMIEKITDYDLG